MAVERDSITLYERWFLTPAGMYVDDKEKELLINSMRFKRDERVLEIGCGSGRYLEYLGDIGLKATGVEPVDELVRRARLKSSIAPDQVIRAPYENIPMAAGTFENVIFMNTFAFSADKGAALKEAYRIASKKIAVGFLNRNSITAVFKVKERASVYYDATPLSGKDILEIAEKNLPSGKYSLKLYYTLYLPIKWGYLMPWADSMLEKANLPAGDFGIAVITKKTPV
jgi:ubiquinone/menaquinone biosynthesis C-methylase UbiE